MRKKKEQNENYLEWIPARADGMVWSEADGLVTLTIPRTGFWNNIAQKLFHRPPTSQVHLEELGSFLWMEADGVRSIRLLADAQKERFGEKAEPVYPRAAEFFRRLEGYHFIRFV